MNQQGGSQLRDVDTEPTLIEIKESCLLISTVILGRPGCFLSLYLLELHTEIRMDEGIWNLAGICFTFIFFFCFFFEGGREWVKLR